MKEFNIADIDKNMKIETSIDAPDVKFYNIDSEPFRIYGVWKDKERGIYVRMPDDVAASVSDGVRELSRVPSGGRVRFVTNSNYVAIHMEYNTYCIKDHMPSASTSGADMYVGKNYANTLCPGNDIGTLKADKLMPDLGCGEKLITVNLPLFSEVKDIYIGLNENATLKRAPEYSIEKPVVFYGSSITHGACSSRPGMTYPAILSRRMDFNFLNLGFAGRAKGEREMAEYIASLDMSAFVLDYDHNAHTLEHLVATHESFFKVIREAKPDLPILILSMPMYRNVEYVRTRQKVIEATRNNAVKAGDKNVWYIPGTNLIREELGADFSVDNCHPTDLGFFSMASSIAPVLDVMLKRYRDNTLL